jgi:predicted phosphodiesterase
MKAVQLAKNLIEEKTDKKTGLCTLSKKKLGEILHQRYPTYFPSAEYGRDAIRRVTGSHGPKDRKTIKVRAEWKGLSLPEPEKNDYSKFLLNEKRVGILSDIHFPYYDKQALNAAIIYLKKWKPDAILLNGDIIDCYQISDFVKDGRKPKFKVEVEIVRQFIIQLKDMFPKTRIVWKLGNHEDRYEKRILQRAPEFLDLAWTTFEGMIKMEGITGVEIVKGKRIILAGKLNIIHGHELPHGIAAPVNPARGFFLRTKANTLGGHHHQSSDHSESDLNGNIIGAWSTGCLCDLHPDYMPVNKWNSGFATLENHGSDFTVRNLKIINGKVL